MTKFRRPKIYIIMKMCHYFRGLLTFADKSLDIDLVRYLGLTKTIGNF